MAKDKPKGEAQASPDSAPEAEAPAAPTYRARVSIFLGPGKRAAKGEALSLSDEDAQALLAQGAVEAL